MARKMVQKYEYVAPQFVDFDLAESSTFDSYFNGQVDLWSKSTIEVSNEISAQSESKEKVNDKDENMKTPLNPAIDNLKKDYRVPLPKTPLSASVSSEALFHESPELEYARPWLNKTCSSLISAMDGLNLSSASKRNSSTPCNRNFNLSMETSTPFITVKERSKSRFMETETNDIPSSKTTEFGEEQNNEIITRVELREIQNIDVITRIENREVQNFKNKFPEKTELKAAKINENNGEEGGDNNSKLDKAAEHSSDQIVPIIEINSPNYKENIQMKIITDKSDRDYPKELSDNFSNNLVKNSSELEKNISEPTDNLELDEHFEVVETEFVKIDSHVDTTEKKEENGRKTKTTKSRIIVNKARRQSLKYRRASGKFVSMAEAILKFQKATPKRFHSTRKTMKLDQISIRCGRSIASNHQHKETTEKNVDKHIETSKKIAQTARLTFDTRKNEPRDKSSKDKTIKTKNAAQTIPAKTIMSRKTKTLPAGTEIIVKTKSEAMSIKLTTSATQTKISPRSATTRTKSASEFIPKTTRKTDVGKIATGATKKLPTNTNTKSTCALSFEERNKLLLMKREEYAKRIIEQEKQARIFHARPAPNFKPVTIHGSSTENLKIQQNYQNFKTSPSALNSNRGGLENQENKPPLNTEERCRKRRVFDAQIKKKEEEEEARRKQEEIERLATMKDQNKEIRKTMELKAKPMPVFKNPLIAKSKKPLTIPQSPAWSRKAKK